VPQVLAASLKPEDTVRARSASATAPLELVTVTVSHRSACCPHAGDGEIDLRGQQLHRTG
jgi:hypothetical protein